MSIFQFKQGLTDLRELEGVIRIPLGIAATPFYLTRLDQALVVWGLVTAAIFFVAQAYWVDWYTQALVWSALSAAAVALAGQLTWRWVSVRNQRWILYVWSALVVAGLALTDYGIFASWVPVLRNLCSLWLGLSALGYVMTGVGIHAPAMVLMGGIHGGAIALLDLFPRYQFLFTGGVMTASLFCLALFHWEHR